MADYETVSEGSHCVRRDVFGQCIYTHNNFSKGNRRLYGMPQKEVKGVSGNKPPPPDIGPDEPLIPLGDAKDDEFDELSYEGPYKEVVTGRLTQAGQDSLHMMLAASINQSHGDTPSGRARGRWAAQQYLNSKMPGREVTVGPNSMEDFLHIIHMHPDEYPRYRERQAARQAARRADAPAEPVDRPAAADPVPDAETDAGGPAVGIVDGVEGKIGGFLDGVAGAIGGKVSEAPVFGGTLKKGIDAGRDAAKGLLKSKLDVVRGKAKTAAKALKTLKGAVDMAKTNYDTYIGRKKALAETRKGLGKGTNKRAVELQRRQQQASRADETGADETKVRDAPAPVRPTAQPQAPPQAPVDNREVRNARAVERFAEQRHREAVAQHEAHTSRDYVVGEQTGMLPGMIPYDMRTFKTRAAYNQQTGRLDSLAKDTLESWRNATALRLQAEADQRSIRNAGDLGIGKSQTNPLFRDLESPGQQAQRLRIAEQTRARTAEQESAKYAGDLGMKVPTSDPLFGDLFGNLVGDHIMPYSPSDLSGGGSSFQNRGQTLTGPTGKRRAVSEARSEPDEPPAVEAPAGAPVEARAEAPAEAPAEPEPKHSLYTAGSRTDMANSVKTVWDWLGNFGAMAGEAAGGVHSGKVVNFVRSKLSTMSANENNRRVEEMQTYMNENGINAGNLKNIGGNSRGAALSKALALRLPAGEGTWKAHLSNMPYYRGEDDGVTPEHAERLINTRNLGEGVTGMRLLTGQVWAPGFLDTGPLRPKGTTYTYRGGAGNALQRHGIAGNANIDDHTGRENMLRMQQMSDGYLHGRMQAIHNQIVGGTPYDNIPEDDKTHLNEEQRQAMSSPDPAVRQTAIDSQRDRWNTSMANEATEADANRRLANPTEWRDKATAWWNSNRVNAPSAIGGVVAGAAGGVALDWAEDKLNIGKHSEYIRPGANALAVNSVLEGAGGYFSGKGMLGGITGAGTFSAVGGAVLGSAIGQLIMPKDGYTSTTQAKWDTVRDGAIGGALNQPLHVGYKLASQAFRDSRAVPGADPAAPAEPPSAASSAAQDTETAGRDALGDAAADDAAVEGLGEAGGDALATVGADVEADAVIGDAFGPMGLAVGAGLGAAFGLFGYWLGSSDFGKNVKANVARIAAKKTDEARQKANAIKDKLRAKAFGRLSSMDSQNLSQSALNYISGNTADAASFLG